MDTTWWSRLLNTLRNERGQIPATTEPDPVDPAPAEPSPEPAEPTAEPATPEQPEAFIDPKDFPAEVQPHWKRMQAAYTKKMQGIASVRDAAETIQRFDTDPAFRKQIFQRYAHELGLPAQQGQPAPQTGTSSGAPPREFVESFRNNLPPELQWMAESQAKAFYAANRMAMAPYEQQLEAQQRSGRESEWDALAAELPPGWEAHEDEMGDLWDFLQSPALRHPVHGSKVELLYRLATGQAAATAQAIERMGQAGRNRSSTGGAGRPVKDNLTDRILKTRVGSNGLREAIQIAGRAAIEELEGKGARFTES